MLLTGVRSYLDANPAFTGLVTVGENDSILGLYEAGGGYVARVTAPDGVTYEQDLDRNLQVMSSPRVYSYVDQTPWLAKAREGTHGALMWQVVASDDGRSEDVVVTVLGDRDDGSVVSAVVVRATALVNAGTTVDANAWLLDSGGDVIAADTTAEVPAIAPGASVDEVDGRTVAFTDDAIVVDQPLTDTGSPAWTVRVEVSPEEVVPGIATLPRTMIIYAAVATSIGAAVALVVWLVRRPLVHTVVRARSDALTGLANRYELESQGQRILDAGAKRPADVAVVVMDLDHFKTVNDSLGHDEGDQVLRAFGHSLTLHTGPRDLVARLGGDEFAVVRWLDLGADPDATVEDLRATVERDLRALVPSASAVGVSAGFTTAALAGSYRIGELLSAADEAMTRGRHGSKGATYAAAATNPVLS
ncbi:GGDEF domain-containing protein [Demequina litorisediminis]|uniref:GGDEF domain-containing protein n=1 Tax=Demequina litorisediminis TaxID=1849022 RepID=A0ABQ6IHN2_9MICO|nr:sensor domain-containing diguanylate cyclase [Demequina litorisediminis]GMA37226.1 hypothetical protein GCM10025876_34300 [Demequina litorisediminis]